MSPQEARVGMTIFFNTNTTSEQIVGKIISIRDQEVDVTLTEIRNKDSATPILQELIITLYYGNNRYWLECSMVDPVFSN